MPNHIKNQIKLTGSIEAIDSLIKDFGTYHKAEIKKTRDGKKIICNLTGDKWGFCWLDLSTGRASNKTDVNQIGLPDGYEIEVHDSFLEFPDFRKVIPPPNTNAYNDLPTQKEAQNFPDWWYNWNTKNWGTKWGAYSCERLAINVFIFETAWAPVPLIINRISKRYPSVTIEYKWADEDTGYNCGSAVYLNGLLTEDIPKGGTKDAYEIAFELRPDYAKDYELINGKYHYKEE